MSNCVIEKVLIECFEKYDSGLGNLTFEEFAKLIEKLEIELLPNYPIHRNFAEHDINNNIGISLKGILIFKCK